MSFGRVDLQEYAGLIPALVMALVVSLTAARRTARFLASSDVLAWAVLMSIGLVLAVTMTPSREAIAEGGVAASGAFCDFSRIGLIPIRQLLSFREPSLNVFLYVPLGVSVGLLARSWRKAALLVAVVAIPFAIEALQGLLPALGRVCESADVVDNLTGLVAGLCLGTLAGATLGRPAEDSSERS